MKGTHGEFRRTYSGFGEKHIQLIKIAEDGQYIDTSGFREATFYRTLSHANIVQCHQITLTENEISIKLEAGSQNLHQFINTTSFVERVKQFPVIFAQCASALQFMHSLGILHGDLTTCNIVLVEGVAKLIDFGSAQFQTATGYNRTATCYPFMSPDVTFNLKVGPHDDMWSLGICMFYYLFKYYPMEYHVSFSDIHNWHKNGSPFTIDKLQIPDVYRNVIRGLLNSKAAERMTANEVIKMLNVPIDSSGVFNEPIPSPKFMDKLTNYVWWYLKEVTIHPIHHDDTISTICKSNGFNETEFLACVVDTAREMQFRFWQPLMITNKTTQTD